MSFKAKPMPHMTLAVKHADDFAYVCERMSSYELDAETQAIINEMEGLEE